MLACQDALHIAPVQVAPREDLVDDEVFGRAGDQRCVRRPYPGRCTLDASFLERQRAERHVHVHAAVGADEQHSVTEGKLAGVASPWGEGADQCIREALLVPEAGQHRQIDILGEPRLAPALNRDAADEAELPVPVHAKALDFASRGQHARQANQGRRARWKSACCSTRPDQSRRSRQAIDGAKRLNDLPGALVRHRGEFLSLEGLDGLPPEVVLGPKSCGRFAYFAVHQEIVRRRQRVLRA